MKALENDQKYAYIINTIKQKTAVIGNGTIKKYEDIPERTEIIYVIPEKYEFGIDDKLNIIDVLEEDYTQNKIFEGESIEKVIEENNFVNDRVYTIKANSKEYSLHAYTVDGDLNVTETNIYGSSSDVATETSTTAKNMVVLKVKGNINIASTGTITAYADENGYGGPKGMIIYCTGTITNEGKISMTARGARAEGEDLYLFKNANGTMETVPADGANGGDSVGGPKNKLVKGNDGENGEGRQTGGGASRICRYR